MAGEVTNPLALLLPVGTAAAGSLALFLDHPAVGVPLIAIGAVGVGAVVADRDAQKDHKQTD